MTLRFLLHLALVCLCGLHLVASAAEEGRVIVKYRASADLLKQAQSADRAAKLSTRLGLSLRSGRRLDMRTEVIRADGISSRDLAARLAGQSDVEFAVPDRLRHIRAVPNDPLYSGQWHLQSTEVAAIRADGAWDLSTGSAGVVIAFVDTGVRYDHPDLTAKLLPGYDFITDALNAGDGDKRDSDASDPGDYITASDTRDARLTALCGPISRQGSSWHGTRVAGILGAASNNSTGVAGTSWGARLLPVRALGKCGGFDSDILAGMRWAAGLSVPGVPDNANPARIINLSLGGPGGCDVSYSSVISELTGKGVLVVAAAGNAAGPAGAPANCPGVLAVAGVRQNGIKVGYSSFGPEISISAPAGNCVDSSGQCLFSIDTTSNSGATVPAANTYTDKNTSNVGTSFSSPMAAGVAALMLSINPGLSPAELINRIKGAARTFPSDPALTNCPSDPTKASSTDQCNCTTSTCGAGLLDAAAAVAAVTPATTPSAHILVLDPLTNASIRLDGRGSTATGGGTIQSWHWQLVTAPAGASLTAPDAASTSLEASSAGTYVVSLSVTDSLRATDTTSINLQVTATAPAPTDPGTSASSGGGGGGALDFYALFGLAGLLGLTYLSRRSQAQRAPAR
ncbi:MAG: S8 family peptidase [Gallionellaceae bacterium]|nr:S8 family peptidase [Gallionellaceae bacterium]